MGAWKNADFLCDFLSGNQLTLEIQRVYNWLQGVWALSEIQDVQNDSNTKANPGVSWGAMLEQ